MRHERDQSCSCSSIEKRREGAIQKIHVVDLRIGASDERESGGADDVRTTGHRAMAQGGPQGRQKLRPALLGGFLRQQHLPPHHQFFPHPNR